MSFWRSRRHLKFILLLILISSACVEAPIKAPPRYNLGPQFQQTGLASWYGRRFHGRLTANGEKFNMNALTCAHRTLPFGSMLRVMRLDTQQSVVVRVNDRGPYAKSRIIDLSREAAEQLGIIQTGIAKVSVVWIKDNKASDVGSE